MTEAVRVLLLDGHLVDVGDLVLHDAGMDVRHPTHEGTVKLSEKDASIQGVGLDQAALAVPATSAQT
jgi:hypothetical protein